MAAWQVTFTIADPFHIASSSCLTDPGTQSDPGTQQEPLPTPCALQIASAQPLQRLVPDPDCPDDPLRDPCPTAGGASLTPKETGA